MPQSRVFNGRNNAGEEDQPSGPSLDQKTALNTAIRSASQRQLSALLQQLCAQSEAAAELVRNHLVSFPLLPKYSTQQRLDSEKDKSTQKPPPPSRQPFVLKSILKPPSSSPAPEGPENPAQAQASPHAPKRKLSAPSQCRNCGSSFSPLGNDNSEPCVHHPGKREVDPEHGVWEDFDSDTFGDAWTLMEYEAFARGFRWSCCKRGTEDVGNGCTVNDRHEAAPRGNWKRVRIS